MQWRQQIGDLIVIVAAAATEKPVAAARVVDCIGFERRWRQ
jgi:hypothetical protein